MIKDENLDINKSSFKVVKSYLALVESTGLFMASTRLIADSTFRLSQSIKSIASISKFL